MATIGTGFDSLLGTRQSTVSPGTTEFYNTQTNQGFSDPNTLSSFVNQNFTGVNTNASNVFNTLSSGYKAPTAISADILNQPVTPTPFAQPNPTATPNIDSLFTTPEITATPQDQQLQAIFDQQQSLNNQLVGKSSFTNQANELYGVNQASQTINDLNAQLIQTKNDQAAIPLLLQQNNSSKGIAQPLIDRQQNYLLQQNAIRALGLSSLMAAAQGQLANAQGLADRAVAAKYDPIQEQLTALSANTDLILKSPNYTIAQKNQAQKQADSLAKQQYQLDLAKQDAANVQQIAIQAAQNGADAQTLLKLQNAKSPIEAAQISATFAKQKDNQDLAASFGVKTNFVNQNGKFFNAKTGIEYSNPQDFFKDAGVSSFAEAYQKGLVTDLNANTQAEQDFAKQAQAHYFDVYIPPTATPQDIQNIIKGSRIYQKETYIAPSGVTATAAANDAITSKLLGSVGTDGKVDPNVYLRERASAKVKPAEFDARYGQYLSSQEQTRLGVAGSSTPIADQYQIETNNRVLQSVSGLMNQVNSSTVGFSGIASSRIPGTPAYNFKSQLETLKSNIAFGALQQMRSASKTGGALGQISDAEERLLSSTLGALDQGQSPEQFKAQLQKIQDSINTWNEANQQYSGNNNVGPVNPNNSGDYNAYLQAIGKK